MRAQKVLKRLSRCSDQPTVLRQVARDVGYGMAQGAREGLQEADEAIRRCLGSLETEDYWSGFASALGTVLTAYEALLADMDEQHRAWDEVKRPSARGVVFALMSGPRTGIELARDTGYTSSYVSKILTTLRHLNVVELISTGPIPERGARKPFALTPRGMTVARKLRQEYGYEVVAVPRIPEEQALAAAAAEPAWDDVAVAAVPAEAEGEDALFPDLGHAEEEDSDSEEAAFDG